MDLSGPLLSQLTSAMIMEVMTRTCVLDGIKSGKIYSHATYVPLAKKFPS